ncbi:MAG: amidohydrolase family protein [Thermoplasmata archaeon]
MTVAANDGIRNLVGKHPDRFLGIVTVSLSDPGFASDEAKRCISDLGLSGIQILSNINGKPIDVESLDQFYSTIEVLNDPIWLHPTFLRSGYQWLKQYSTDIMLGWDIDMTLALFRLYRGGTLNKHSRLKSIVHHLGSLIPVLAGRIANFATQDADYKSKTDPLDLLRSFYVDTAEGMWKPWLDIALDFFGTSHVLFGTDYPWGDSPGIIRNIEELSYDQETKEAIFSGNAKKLMHIKL